MGQREAKSSFFIQGLVGSNSRPKYRVGGELTLKLEWQDKLKGTRQGMLDLYAGGEIWTLLSEMAGLLTDQGIPG